MFKLESYVTPLLLSYVNKYIKNLKPEDSQLSLWDGDASFCNLDLRLDVLEQELELPFTFVNGHIHELRIHVPWTKLGSEPVVITINTIECVLKLCGESNITSDASTSLLHSTSSSLRKHHKKEETPEAPPGYVQSLINRVISNICIVCNNLILKYVEDDIVLSLNIKSAELFNVDENWERAFVDINLSEAVVRKVINMQDLTVCLDKRDASGKIEAYQDPLLYRCSTQWRIHTVYSAVNAKYPSITRVNMFCDKLDFSLTDQQIPMFLRLAKLCYALQYKDSYLNKETKECEGGNHEKAENLESEVVDSWSAAQNDSWGSWMWSLVPFSWDEETDEASKETEQAKLQKIFQFGVFIERASCVFKVTEAFSDTCFGSAKCSFSPFAVLHFYGCCMEITMRGKDFLNVQHGVTGATVSGQNSCVCGFPGKPPKEMLFMSGSSPESGSTLSYLSSTLFDPSSPENCGKKRKYCFDAEQHLGQLTEELMSRKFPAFFMDYLYTLEIPEDWLDKASQVTSTFLEESNWQERSVCRFVLGPFCADVTSQSVHIIEKIIHCSKDYDYPSYLAPERRKKSMGMSEVTQDDIDSLEAFTPLRSYTFTLFKPVLRLSVADHSPVDAVCRLQRKKLRKKKRNQEFHVDSSKSVAPYLILEVSANSIQAQYHCAMYPERFAQIVSTVPVPSENLLYYCYSNYLVDVMHGEALLLKQDSTHRDDDLVLPPMTVSTKMESLNCPQYWIKHSNFSVAKIGLNCSSLKFSLAEKHLLSLICLYQSWMARDFNFESFYNCPVFSIEEKGECLLQSEICGIECLFVKTMYGTIYKGSVSSVCIRLQDNDHSTVLLQAPESTKSVHDGQKWFCPEDMDVSEASGEELGSWLQLLIHIPEMRSSDPCLLTASAKGAAVCLEPAFLTWLPRKAPSCLNENITGSVALGSPTDLDEDSLGSSRTTPVASGSRSLSKEHSVITDSTKCGPLFDIIQKFLVDRHHHLRHLILQVDIAAFIVLCPKFPWCVPSYKTSSLQSWKHAHKKLTDACFLCLPKIHVRNNGASGIVGQVFRIHENELLSLLRKDEGRCDGFPWTVKIDNLSMYTVSSKKKPESVMFFLNPSGASATIALTSKPNYNMLALCVHIDTTALNMNFSSIQVSLISECINSIWGCVQLSDLLKSWMLYFLLKPCSLRNLSGEDKFFSAVKWEGSPASERQPQGIKFGEAGDTADKVSLEKVLGNDDETKKITFWVQLTVSKFSFNFFGATFKNTNDKGYQFQFVSEEVITSLDIQDVYSKAKMKIESLNINCFLRKNNEWHNGPYKGIVLCCSNKIRSTKSWTNNSVSIHRMNAKVENQPFLVFTYTRASCVNANQKWTANFDESVHACVDADKYISEVDLCLRPLDIILWPALLQAMYEVLLSVKSMNRFSVQCSTDSNPCARGAEFSNQTLPLIYVKSSAVRIFMPKHSFFGEDQNFGCDSEKKSPAYKPDMLCLCLDGINLTSQVENPLSRIILNGNLYASALKTKTLNLPGADIEDRQYQLDVYGLSLGSVFGIEITTSSYENEGSHSGYLPIMGENPALEWNIGVINEGRKNCDQEPVAISPFLSSFDVRLAVAPAIVSRINSCVNGKEEIVAGITVEVSVTNDIFAYFSAAQMELLTAIVDSISVFKEGTVAEPQNKLTPVKHNPQELQRDSGIESETSTLLHCNLHSECARVTGSAHDFVPFEVLVTASSLSLILFVQEEDMCREEKGHIPPDSTSKRFPQSSGSSCKLGKSAYSLSPFKSQLASASFWPYPREDDGYDGSSDSSGNDSGTMVCHAHTKPTVASSVLIAVVQPHAFVKCHPVSQRFEVSCFDFQLKGCSPDVCTKQKSNGVPTIADFSLPYVETRPGEPDEKTGIPPAFCTFTCSEFFHEPATAILRVERPFKCNFNAYLWDQYEMLLKSFSSKMGYVSTLQVESTDKHTSALCECKESQKRSRLKFSVLSHMGLVKFSTTQVQVEIFVECSPDPVVLLVMLDEFIMEVTMTIEESYVENVRAKVNIKNLSSKLSALSEIWPILLPASASVTFNCQLYPYFQITSYVDSEALLLNISLKHVLILSDAVKSVMDFWSKKVANHSFWEQQNRTQNISTPNQQTSIVTRQYWSDDLRKGSFHFIQSPDKQHCLPNAHEVIFLNAVDNEPAAMIWRYPEPRSVTKIEVSPVPLHSSTGKGFQTVACCVQYWDSLHHEFRNLCDFELSETSHCHLDFPLSDTSSVAFSDLWRVVLHYSAISAEQTLKKKETLLSPLVLAACMSIDSCFDKNLLPSLQLTASLSLLRISLHSVFSENGCTDRMFPFEFDGSPPIKQEFMSLSLDNMAVQCLRWCTGFKLEVSSDICCSIIEYRSLTMLPIFEPINLNLNVNFSSERLPVIEIEAKIQSCVVKVSQSVVHTLKYALYSCSKVLNERSRLHSSEYMLPNYYIVCNNIQELIRFGQVDTDESIILPSHKMHAYSWRSQKCKQLLHICLECMKWNWSEGFDIDTCGSQVINLDNSIVIHIIVKQLSNLQKQIIFEGYLTVFNHLPQDIHFKLGIFEQGYNATGIPAQKEIKTKLRKFSSISLLVAPQISMKLALKCTSDATVAWSKYMSIHSSSQNVIVELPCKVEKHILVQMRRKKTDDCENFMYIFLSPQLIIRNHLPYPLVSTESKLCDQEGFSTAIIPGKGCEIFFYDELNFRKPIHLYLDECKRENHVEVPMADVEELFLKPVDGSIDVEPLTSIHPPQHQVLWPYTDCSELVNHSDLLQCMKASSSFTAEEAKFSGVKIMTETSLKWSGLSTVLVDVKPWALFVNCLETDLVLKDKHGNMLKISSHSVQTPPFLDGNFTVGIIIKNETFLSSPVCMFHAKKAKKQNYSDDISLITDNVIVVIKLKAVCNEVIAFQLNSNSFDGMYVIKAVPVFCIKNNSTKDIHLACAVVPVHSQSDVRNTSKLKESTVAENSGAESAVLFFSCFDCDELLLSVYDKQNIAFYMAFCLCKSNKHKWSRPIQLTLEMASDMRHTVSIPSETTEMPFCCTVPFVVTSHKRHNVFFLLLSDDPSPFLLLCNQTDLQLFYGQCISKADKVCVYEELDDKIALPSLAPGESCYYTFPALQKHFPSPLDSLPRLHFGLLNSQTCSWSPPIDISYTSQFVCIPELNYVRISQVRQGCTICLYIDSVNRVEFTAKEIRSRIGLSSQCTAKSFSGECTPENSSAKFCVSSDLHGAKIQHKKPSGLVRAEDQHEQILSKSTLKSLAVCLTLRADNIGLIICDEIEVQGACLEVIRISIDNAFLYSRSNQTHSLMGKTQDVCICFGSFQIDNQMDREGKVVFDFPVILKQHSDIKSCPVENSFAEFLPNKARESSFVTIDMVLDVTGNNKFFMKMLNINFQPLALYVEDALYFKVQNLYASFIPYTFHEHADQGSQCTMFPKDVICRSVSMAHPVWIKHLKISIKEVYLTVHASLKLYFSVESSKLKFQEFERHELFTNYHELGRLVVIHYLTGTLFRAGWVVAALDILGNPANFARAVGLGLSDFVLLPYHGLLNGPRAFISGLSHGAASLISGISSGAITCVTNLAASISRNMDILSFDPEHFERQEALRRQLPSGITGGLVQGLSGLGISLLGAVAGVVDHPLQVIVSPSNPVNTAKGIVGGLGKGLIGVFTKPVGGAAEFVSQTGHGLLQGAGWLHQPKRLHGPSSLTLSNLCNSSLKFLWKISQLSALGDVLFVISGTYVNNMRKHEAVALLLTSEFLCVFSKESDMQTKTFALRELKCEKSDTDANALLISHSDRPEEGYFQDFSSLKDRVADYVQKSWQYSSGNAHLDFEDTSAKLDASTLTFFVDLKLRNVFHALFVSAQRKIQRKGFPN